MKKGTIMVPFFINVIRYINSLSVVALYAFRQLF